MNEKLLQYIWKFRLFNATDLFTTCLKRIVPIYQGIHNTNQGPDFLNARIKIGDSTWAGNIELHVKSSDWVLHRHSEDENYSNVILHVVWVDDKKIDLPFPTVEIQSHVPKILLTKYSNWMQTRSFIACENSIQYAHSLILTKCKEQMLMERLQLKSKYIAQLVEQSKGDWDEVCWWVIARNFGGRVNGDDFENIAKSIPFKWLQKNRNSIHTIESIIFGQSGLLSNDFKDAYPKALIKEYKFYKKKYNLISPKVSLKFLRMRPLDFPTIKLAQLSAFISQIDRLFDFVNHTIENGSISNNVSIILNEYWDHHYCFDDQSIYKNKTPGKSTEHNIVINSFVQLIYAFGDCHQDEEKCNMAISHLVELKAENNTIIKSFRKMNIAVDNAFDSQALLQLYNNYCINKKCLDCSIGYDLIKKDSNLKHHSQS